MVNTTSGVAVPRVDKKPTDAMSAWFAWRAKYPERADDPIASYEFGVKIGQALAIERTASWAGLVPLLQDVLDYLIALAIEREAEG